MRYFFVSYACRNNKKTANGNIFIENDVFPSNHTLIKNAAERSGFGRSEIVITLLFEFKNEFDFNSFTGR